MPLEGQRAEALPKEFHQDVVRVPRDREPGVSIRQIVNDFGIAESCLGNWLRAADVEDGVKAGRPRPQKSSTD